MNREKEQQEIHLSDYLMVVLKRRTLVILICLLIVSLGFLYTHTAKPVYQSSARLLIDKVESSSPVTGEKIIEENPYSPAMTFNTHFELILSSAVIDKVIMALNLDQQDAQKIQISLEVNRLKALIKQFKANLQLLMNRETKVLSPHEKRQSLINSIRSKITVEQIEKTKLLQIMVQDKNPGLSTDIANALATEYIKFNLNNKLETSKQTLEWLNNELYEERKKLEQAEKKFFDFKQEHKVFSMSGKQKMVDQKIMEFNNNYLKTRNKRLGLDERIKELKNHLKGAGTIANVRSLIDNPIIHDIYNKIVEYKLELSRLSKVFKSKHPQIIEINTKITRSNISLSQEITKELNNLNAERKVIYASEENLAKNIEEFESEALEIGTNELQYNILQRKVNTSQKVYDLMVERIKESNLLQTDDSSNIRLVEKAIVPLKPVSPDPKKIFIYSLLAGLFVSISLAFFLEYFDQTIRTEEDIRMHINLPVLSAIPNSDKSKTYGINA